jgi:acyl carrier protein
VEIQLRIKKKFKVEITPELFSSGQLKNLGDLYAYIETHQPQPAVA